MLAAKFHNYRSYKTKKKLPNAKLIKKYILNLVPYYCSRGLFHKISLNNDAVRSAFVLAALYGAVLYYKTLYMR